MRRWKNTVNGEVGSYGSNLAEMILYKFVKSALLNVKAVILNGVFTHLFFLFNGLNSLCFLLLSHNIQKNGSDRIFQPLSLWKGLMEPLATISPAPSFYSW